MPRILPFSSSAISPLTTWSRPPVSVSIASERLATHLTGRPQRRAAHSTSASSG
jgi:hypothetical protein